MTVVIPTVRCLRQLNASGGIPAPVGTTVTIGGYLSDTLNNGAGDGGGGSFTAVHADGTTAGAKATGEPMMPDHGLLFPTADPDIFLLRDVPWRVVPVSELAPHALSEDTRVTIMATGPTNAAWWGAVPGDASFTAACATAGPAGLGGGFGLEATAIVPIVSAPDLYKAVRLVGGDPDANPTDAAVFEVYPFLREGVFLQRNERSDWREPPERIPYSGECGSDRKTPNGDFGPGLPSIRFMPFHFVALQAAIERSEDMSQATGSGLTIDGGTYRTNRHLTVRKPRTIRFPDADAANPAVFDFYKAGYPQNAVLMILPSWETMVGGQNTQYFGGDFADEHVYGEPVPAVQFEIADSPEPFGGFADSVFLPLDDPTPALQAGRDLFFRLGRTDQDSAEPFKFEWRKIGSVTADSGGTRVALMGDVLPRPTVMQMTIAGIDVETQPPTEDTCDGINFEGGVHRVTLTNGLTKSLKAHNPQFFDVPFWRTQHIWTGGTVGGPVVTQLLHKKTCVDQALSLNSPFYFVGDDVLRLCVVGGASDTELSVGATAEWGRESWAFLPLTDPDGSQILGRIHAQTAVEGSVDNGGAVQAYNCRNIFIEDVVAEALPDDPMNPNDGASRFDRAVILTTTEDAVVGAGEVRTTRRNPTDTFGRRAWAIDLQQTRRSTVGTARMVQSHGGGVQFEEGDGDAIGTNLPPGVPALDVALVPLADTERTLGTAIETTYTSDACSIGPVVVRAAQGELLGTTEPFGRTRYALIGVAGSPTDDDPTVELTVGAMDVQAELLLVQPYYLEGLDFDQGEPETNAADRFIYRTGNPDENSQVVEFQASRLVELSGTEALSGSAPVVVPLSGVARRISATLGPPANKPGQGEGVLWHRQGGSALVAGDLRPEQGADEQAALEVYTGLGWREYGYFVAVPGPGGWPTGATLDWSAEVFIDDADSTPPPAVEVVVQDVEFNAPNPTFLDFPAAMGGQYLVGLQVAFVDLNPAPGVDTVIQMGGKMTLTITPKDGARTRDRITVVSGENAEVIAGQVFVDLHATPAAIVPARGARQFFADDMAGPRLQLSVATQNLPGGDDFALSGSGPHRLRVIAILSK